MTAAQRGGSRTAGGSQRPKHVPQRTCVVCREKGGKRTLTRIVRLLDGSVVIDPTGKQNGRGAYLCEKPGCWERAAASEVLSQALRATISTDTRAYLRDYATEHPPVETGVMSEERTETTHG